MKLREIYRNAAGVLAGSIDKEVEEDDINDYVIRHHWNHTIFQRTENGCIVTFRSGSTTEIQLL